MASNKWQSNTGKICERAKFLYNNSLWADCGIAVIIDDEKKVFYCHKLILSMASPVFADMYFGEREKTINIPNMTVETIDDLLKYIYTDEVEFDLHEHAEKLRALARSLEMYDLVKKCTTYLWKDFNPFMACEGYEYGKEIREHKLMEQCMKVIKERTPQVLQSSKFKTIKLETLLDILNQNELNISSEVQLYNAVGVWASAECSRLRLPVNRENRRRVADQALKMIRFLSMKKRQFKRSINSTDFLTDEEIQGMYNSLQNKELYVLPDGFTKSRSRRKIKSQTDEEDDETDLPQIFCILYDEPTIACCDVTEINCVLGFSVNANIALLGVIVPTQRKPKGTNVIKTENCKNDPEKQRDKCMEVEHEKAEADVKDLISIQPLDGQNIHVVDMNEKSSKQSKNPDGVSSKIGKYYKELVYIELYDEQDKQLASINFKHKVQWDSGMEIMFDHPVDLKQFATYYIRIVFYQKGSYKFGECLKNKVCDGVNFRFYYNTSDKINQNYAFVQTIIYREEQDMKVKYTHKNVHSLKNSITK